MSPGLSLIYPVHNEGMLLKSALLRTIDYLKREGNLWEIIVVDNGSIDDTTSILEEISRDNPTLIYTILKDRGLGRAIQEGIRLARYDTLMFYAIDVPFGFDAIKDSCKKLETTGADIIIGSKNHRDSINQAPFKRKVLSYIYNKLLHVFFKLNIKDTQGSLTFTKNAFEKVKSYCTAHDAFFCTQMIIYSKKVDLKVLEIPVVYRDPRKNSKVKLAKDGKSLLRQLLAEHRKFKT